LQELLGRYEHDALEVAVADEAVLLDMDVPEDYQFLLDYLGRRAVPTIEECHSLLWEAGVDEPVWGHCQMVAGLALELVQSLNQTGADVSDPLADMPVKYENDRQARQAAEQRLKQAERIKKKVKKSSADRWKPSDRWLWDLGGPTTK